MHSREDRHSTDIGKCRSYHHAIHLCPFDVRGARERGQRQHQHVATRRPASSALHPDVRSDRPSSGPPASQHPGTDTSAFQPVRSGHFWRWGISWASHSLQDSAIIYRAFAAETEAANTSASVPPNWKPSSVSDGGAISENRTTLGALLAKPLSPGVMLGMSLELPVRERPNLVEQPELGVRQGINALATILLCS